jgi:hypothetical protein
MTTASVQILLPFALNCYENIKKFLESVKQVLPEETKDEWGRVSSNYNFAVKPNEFGFVTSYAGTRDILNLSYGHHLRNYVGPEIILGFVPRHFVLIFFLVNKRDASHYCQKHCFNHKNHYQKPPLDKLI